MTKEGLHDNLALLKQEYIDFIIASGMNIPEDAPSLSDLHNDIERRVFSDDILRHTHARRLIELVDLIPSIAEAINSEDGRKKPNQLGLNPSYQTICDGTGKLSHYLQVILDTLAHDDVKLDQYMYIDIYPTNQFNACAKKIFSGYLCLLNTGLLMLLYHLTMSAYCQVDCEEDNNPIHIKYCIQHIYEYLIHSSHSPSFIENHFVDKSLIIEANSLVFAMKVFVLAHEIAHVILGHVPIAMSRCVSTVSGAHSFLSNSHEDEYAADIFAQQILIRADELGKFPFPLKGGGIAFLLIHAMVNEVGSKLFNILLSTIESRESHPRTMDRIRRLDEVLSTYFAETGKERNEVSPLVLLQRCLIDIESKTFSVTGNT